MVTEIVKGQEYSFDPLFHCGVQSMANLIVVVKSFDRYATVVESINTGEVFRVNNQDLVSYPALVKMYNAYCEVNTSDLGEQCATYQKIILDRMERMLFHFEVQEATKFVEKSKGD